MPLALRTARRLARHHQRATLALIFLFATLFRLVMLFAGLPPPRPVTALAHDLSGSAVGYQSFLLYDNDIWRYLWDGHLTARGSNPYSQTPAQIEELAFDDELSAAGQLMDEAPWEEVWERISYRNHTSVYPPASQLLFALSHWVAPGSVFVFKFFVAAFDLASCWVLVLLLSKVGRGREEVLLYAWNPLAIKEFAGSGHVDAVMIFLLLAALHAALHGQRRRAGAWWAGSVLVKVAPLPLAGVLLGRRPWRHGWTAALVATLLCLPFLSGLPHFLGGLATYSREWIFNAGPFNLLTRVLGWLPIGSPSSGAHWVSRLLILGTILWVTLAYWRASDEGNGSDDNNDNAQRQVDSCFLILAALVIFGPAIMPWYLLWAAPLAVAVGLTSWSWLTALSLLSYLVYWLRHEHAAYLWIEYGGFVALLVWELRRKRELSGRLGKLLRLH